jgi:serine/threonine-protein kinase RsbW
VITHGYEEAGLQGDNSIEAARLDDSLINQLVDAGKSYDPHAHTGPDDVALAMGLEDRPIGGLGIMRAMDGVDDLKYESSPSPRSLA